MEAKLTLSELALRMKTYTKDNYSLLNSVIKGATVANAAFTLAIILAGGSLMLPRLPFWLASFAALVMTHNAAFSDIVLTNYRATWADSFLPMLVGLLEFLLFSILQQEPTNTVWRHWYIVFAIFCLSASLIVWHITAKTKLEDYDVKLQDLVTEYLSWRNKDKIASSINFVIWISVWAIMFFVVLPNYPDIEWLYSVGGFFALIVMIYVLSQKERQRRQIYHLLSTITDEQN